jgi:hypothetical protein
MRRERAGSTHHEIVIDRPGLISARTENLKNEIVASLKPEPIA